MTTSPVKIVLATANPHKVEEILAILEPLVAGRFVIVPRPESIGHIDETGRTLEQNAVLKAKVVADATGYAAVGDDTGLEVDAIGGAPGVYSARYAGEDATAEANMTKLLGALEGTSQRGARFRTAAAVVFPDGRTIVANGTVEGRIGEHSRGSSGFGYDPIFLPDGMTRSFAELSSEEKHAISHRGKAFRALATALLDSLAAQEGA